MPRGDRRGPEGMGPRTGRAAGYCAGYDRPGYTNPDEGRGSGRGRGRGSGGGQAWRRRRGGGGRGAGWDEDYAVQPAPAPVDERSILQEELADLKARIAQVDERLARLDGTEETEADG